MDDDITRYILLPYNLEAMKLSSYFKQKGEIVVLSTEFTPNRHQKFFYRKDYDDGTYPDNLTTVKNVEYGGFAFSNNKYIALPSEVEIMMPDTSLYSKLEPLFISAGKQFGKKVFNQLMNAEHCRLSLDGKTIWPDYTRQFRDLSHCRNIILHDYDLGRIENSFETVKDLLARARTDGWATKIGMKFPIQIYNGESLLNWSSLNGNPIFYSAQYNGVIDDNVFLKWVNMNIKHSTFTNITYHVTAPRYDENDFVMNLLPKIFHQVLISRSYRIFFLLKYDKGFFLDQRWCRVLDLINAYAHSMHNIEIVKYLQKIGTDTMYDFVNAITHIKPLIGHSAFTKEELRNLFNFVREHNYPLFKDFYECNANSLGGKL